MTSTSSLRCILSDLRLYGKLKKMAACFNRSKGVANESDGWTDKVFNFSVQLSELSRYNDNKEMKVIDLYRLALLLSF